MLAVPFQTNAVEANPKYSPEYFKKDFYWWHAVAATSGSRGFRGSVTWPRLTESIIILMNNEG